MPEERCFMLEEQGYASGKQLYAWGAQFYDGGAQLYDTMIVVNFSTNMDKNGPVPSVFSTNQKS